MVAHGGTVAPSPSKVGDPRPGREEQPLRATEWALGLGAACSPCTPRKHGPREKRAREGIGDKHACPVLARRELVT